MCLNSFTKRFTCSWPRTTLVLLCDGRVVCGCADPYGKRVVGDARKDSIASIWHGDTMAAIRSDLDTGKSLFCEHCPLKLPVVAAEETSPVKRPDVPALPSRLFIEPTVACNISCFEACCGNTTGIGRTRTAGMLDFDLFTRVVDETGPSLGRIDFFNYGESFLHKRAVEMCEYIKQRFPHIYLYTSTNGLAFTEESSRRLVHSGIDEVTFSIDGATPETYLQYRQKGNFETAIRNLRTMADEKKKAGRDLPFLNWRYILFKWNDSDEEMNLARQMALDFGVDRLAWEITDHPEEAYSKRFLPDTDDYKTIYHEIWDNTSGLGNAIWGATPRARIELSEVSPQGALTAHPLQSLQIHTRVENICSRPFPAQATYGRRMVRLGAQLYDGDGKQLQRDYARATLPCTINPGAMADVLIEIVAPETRGCYRLKFDLVSEGIDWFEKCGSDTLTKTFVVR